MWRRLHGNSLWWRYVYIILVILNSLFSNHLHFLLILVYKMFHQDEHIYEKNESYVFVIVIFVFISVIISCFFCKNLAQI